IISLCRSSFSYVTLQSSAFLTRVTMSHCSFVSSTVTPPSYIYTLSLHDALPIFQSAYPIASGGLAASLTNSVCKSNSLGATISLQDHMTVELFSETQSRMIVSVSLKSIKAIEQLVADAYKIGEVTKDPTLKICKNDITYIHENVCELKNIWKEAHTWTKV